MFPSGQQLLNGTEGWHTWRIAMKAAFLTAGVYEIMKPVFEPTFDYNTVAKSFKATTMKRDQNTSYVHDIALGLILTSARTATLFPLQDFAGVIDDPIRLWAKIQYCATYGSQEARRESMEVDAVKRAEEKLKETVQEEIVTLEDRLFHVEVQRLYAMSSKIIQRLENMKGNIKAEIQLKKQSIGEDEDEDSDEY